MKIEVTAADGTVFRFEALEARLQVTGGEPLLIDAVIPLNQMALDNLPEGTQIVSLHFHAVRQIASLISNLAWNDDVNWDWPIRVVWPQTYWPGSSTCVAAQGYPKPGS